jgi:hypothetical protein
MAAVALSAGGFSGLICSLHWREMRKMYQYPQDQIGLEAGARSHEEFMAPTHNLLDVLRHRRLGDMQQLSIGMKIERFADFIAERVRSSMKMANEKATTET